MRLILKYRNKIVSLGLLPIIATLICLHFLPNTAVLGISFVVCFAFLLYGILRIRDLNFFLLLGCIGIGACFILRLFTGYQFVPYGSITPILELLLLIVAFIHITAPEIYKGLQEQLHLRNCFSFVFEAKTIVILSTLHLLTLLFTEYIGKILSEEAFFFMLYGVPVIIYIVCLLINIIGIQLALQDNFRYSLVRIAPVCDGKIYLERKMLFDDDSEDTSAVWDIPLESSFEGPLDKSDRYARKITKKMGFSPKTTPRLILSYQNHNGCATCKQRVSLYILPMSDVEELKSDSRGRFFSFEEIKAAKQHEYSPALLSELGQLEIAAQMWKEFG